MCITHINELEEFILGLEGEPEDLISEMSKKIGENGKLDEAIEGLKIEFCYDETIWQAYKNCVFDVEYEFLNEEIAIAAYLLRCM